MNGSVTQLILIYSLRSINPQQNCCFNIIFLKHHLEKIKITQESKQIHPGLMPSRLWIKMLFLGEVSDDPSSRYINSNWNSSLGAYIIQCHEFSKYVDKVILKNFVNQSI